MNEYILTFGHIPKFLGGRQSSGLSYVMWKIASTINQTKTDLKVVFVSTDIFIDNSKIENTEVLGWNKKLLLKYIYRHLFYFINIFIHCVVLSCRFRLKFITTLAKLVFYDYSFRYYNNRVKVVHVHGVNNYIILTYLINKYKKKAVLTIHGITGLDKNIPRWKTQNRLEKFVSVQRNLSEIVFVTTETKTVWINTYGLPYAEVSVILNGLDSKQFYFCPNKIQKRNHEIVNILTIGSIIKLKGQERVLKALSELPEERKRVFRYCMIGTGRKSEIDYLLDFAKAKNINVNYLEYCYPENLNSILHETDYLIQPSSTEGFGLVFLESIACGTPVIVPRNLPIAMEGDILNRTNSIKITDYSSEAIRDCLVCLQPWQISRKEVSQSVTKYDWKTVASQYISVFDKLIGS